MEGWPAKAFGLVALVLFLGQPVLSQSAGFLKISGVDGGSKDGAHKGWIDVMSYSWGGRMPATGSGPGSLTLVTKAGKSSSNLGAKAGSGEKIPEVVLESSGAGTDGKPGTWVYRMTDVTIGSYKPGGGSIAQESMTLNYVKISWTYTAQK